MVIVQILIIVFLFMVHGFLAMLEFAVVKARKSKFQTEADEGDKLAALALTFLESPQRLFSTLQMLMALVVISATIYATVCFAGVCETALQSFGFYSEYSRTIGYVLVALSMASVWLVFGEIIPKNIAMVFPDAIVKRLSPFLYALTHTIGPVVGILEKLSKAILNLFGCGASSETNVTEEEIRDLISKGSEDGVIDKAEESIVSKVFLLGDRRADTIMTPRQNIVWLDANEPVEKIWKEVSESDFTYFPLADGSVENIIGIVSNKDLAAYLLEKGSDDIRSLAWEPLRVPSNTSALNVLELFKQSTKRIALVLDEYGGIDGLITTHNLLEALVGDLKDSDDTEPGYVRRQDGSFLVDAGMDLDDLFILLDLPAFDHEDHPGYHSLGGFILKNLGHLPVEGEKISYSGYTFEVIDMDRHRVDKVLISKSNSSK